MNFWIRQGKKPVRTRTGGRKHPLRDVVPIVIGINEVLFKKSFNLLYNLNGAPAYDIKG